VGEIPEGDLWTYELKLDGYRSSWVVILAKRSFMDTISVGRSITPDFRESHDSCDDAGAAIVDLHS
jgi:hypothetical protein